MRKEMSHRMSCLVLSAYSFIEIVRVNVSARTLILLPVQPLQKPSHLRVIEKKEKAWAMLGSLLRDGILQKRQLVFSELWHFICTIWMLLNVVESIIIRVGVLKSTKQHSEMSVQEEKREKNEQFNKIDVKNRENWNVLWLETKSTWKMHKKWPCSNGAK